MTVYWRTPGSLLCVVRPHTYPLITPTHPSHVNHFYVSFQSVSETELKDKASASAKKKESYEEAQRRKKEQKAAQSAAAKAANANKDEEGGAGGGGEFSKMDIRVGKIVKVWNHVAADKLFCEEINVGEESGPRQITSGLRDYYTLEEMQDRLVLVVCNLKAAKIVDFMSNGMVLAAKSADGTRAELITPPEGSSIGERVFIEGLEMGEPYSSAQTKKKKTWNIVAEDLKTGEDGVALWQGQVIRTSAGPCKAASLVGVAIS